MWMKKLKNRRKEREKTSGKNKIKGECEINWVFVYTKSSDSSYYQHRAMHLYINLYISPWIKWKSEEKTQTQNETGKSWNGNNLKIRLISTKETNRAIQVFWWLTSDPSVIVFVACVQQRQQQQHYHQCANGKYTSPADLINLFRVDSFSSTHKHNHLSPLKWHFHSVETQTHTYRNKTKTLNISQNRNKYYLYDTFHCSFFLGIFPSPNVRFFFRFRPFLFVFHLGWFMRRFNIFSQFVMDPFQMRNSFRPICKKHYLIKCKFTGNRYAPTVSCLSWAPASSIPFKHLPDSIVRLCHHYRIRSVALLLLLFNFEI